MLSGPESSNANVYGRILVKVITSKHSDNTDDMVYTYIDRLPAYLILEGYGHYSSRQAAIGAVW